MKKWVLLVCALAVSITTAVFAHQASDSYLVVNMDGTNFSGRWDIAFRDLDVLMELDVDGDGSITRGEFNRQLDGVLAIASENLVFQQGNSVCLLDHTKQNSIMVNDEPYLSLNFLINCPNPDAPILLQYIFLFESDLSHQSLLKLIRDGEETTGIITADKPTVFLNEVSTAKFFQDFFVSGFSHIMGGLDHILFLLVLVFAIVLIGQRSGKEKKQIALDAIKLLTAFTVAHAITLSLAQMGVISVPGRLVESAIGLSVAVAALDIYRPFLGSKKWLTAFIFGLIHGLGFASALGQISATGTDLLIALTAFNLGIEIGQVVLASLALTFLYLFLPSEKVRQVFSWVFAGVALSIGLYWFVTRSFGL